MAAPPPPPPAQPPQKKEVSPYEEKFKTLMAAVTNAASELPKDLQDTAKALAEPEAPPVAATLEQAFEYVGQARAKVDHIQMARFQMHKRWRDFLATAASQFQEFTQSFTQQESSMLQEVSHAKAGYKAAKAQFDKMKAASGPTDLEVEVISDEEGNESKDARPDAGTILQETMNSMHTTFESLRSTADNMLVEEQSNKKRKSAEEAAPAPSSLEPFGGPGR